MDRQREYLRFGRELAVLALVFGLVLASYSYLADALPQGATLGTPSVDTGPTVVPDSLTNPGGRIITVDLSLEQQNGGWKAYIGNVSGLYVLQNAVGDSIYEWPLSLVQGEVYISRNASINFSSISCAGTSVITAENTFFGYAGADDDAINKTFNSTAHRTFDVGPTNIPANTCPATALWVNDTQQGQSSSAIWQEVLLNDSSNRLVYASLMNNDRSGFDTATYDFQAIIADNRSSVSGTTYYFYVELG